MNRIRKTEGLVLRVSPYSNTSHVVTWLTPDHGAVTTAVKGAMRPRSGFLGQYDLFYTCELLYYARERGGVHVAKDCSPITVRAALREHWRAYAVASYAAHLLLRVAQPEDAERRVYALANSFLDRLLQAAALPAETCLWFETRFLAASGFGPKLNRCSACGKSPRHPEAGGASWTLLPRSGAVTCPACAPSGAEAGAVILRRESLLRMVEWADEALESPAPAGVSRNELLETGLALGRLVEWYLHAEPAYRKLAYELSSVRTARRALPEKRQ